MATLAGSRYTAGGVQIPMNTTTTSEASGNKSETSSGTSVGQGTQTQNAVNMSPEALAALNLLMRQLLGGGTQNMAKDEAQRQGEIKTVQAQRAGYSKDAALGDAQGLIAQTLRQAMESVLPGIVRATEGAGTSGNALAALLQQDAASRASQAASAVGVNAATNYGQVAANLSNTLEALTRPNDQATNALINLLQVAKGAVTNSTTNTSEVKQTTGSSQGSSSSSGSEVKTNTPITSTGRPDTNVQYFGPTNPNAGKLPDEFLYSALYQLNKDNFTSNLTF